MASILVFVCCVFVGCVSDGGKDYVVITFVTNSNTTIDPVVLDGKSDKFMPDDPLRAGYEFAGWYYDQLFLHPFSTADAITMDITLYAKWISLTPDEDTKQPEKEDNKGIKYSYEEGAYTVIGYTGEQTELTVPARYDGTPVLRIAAGAFSGTSVRSVSLGENIISIGDYAFRDCAELQEINVTDNNGFYSSADGILYNKDKTTLIVVPQKTAVKELAVSGVSVVFPYAFEGCTLSVNFCDEEYKTLDSYVCAGFDGKVTLGSGISEISKEAFSQATCEVIFGYGNSLSVLRNGAFADYYGDKLVLPGTLSAIEWQAFYGCTATVDMSKTYITEIGEKAFAGYKGEKLEIPAEVTKIGKNAFYGARTTITFMSGSLYTEIGEEAFAGFGGSDAPGTYSGRVVFPAGIAKVGKNAFYGSYSYVEFASAEKDMIIDEKAFNYFKGQKSFVGAE